MSIKRRSAIVAASLAATALTASTAYAVVTTQQSGPPSRVFYTHSTQQWSNTTNSAWVDIPGAVVRTGIQPGRIVNARFGGESRCSTITASDYCSVRIVAVRSDGTIYEFNPQSGLDFAFDSGGFADYQSTWHALMMERTSNPMPEGSYTIKAQARIVYGTGHHLLDDYTFVVEVMQP